MVGLLPAASYSPSIRRHPRCIRPSPFDIMVPIKVFRALGSLINQVAHRGIFRNTHRFKPPARVERVGGVPVREIRWPEPEEAKPPNAPVTIPRARSKIVRGFENLLRNFWRKAEEFLGLSVHRDDNESSAGRVSKAPSRLAFEFGFGRSGARWYIPCR
jgi:hypothetical protein